MKFDLAIIGGGPGGYTAADYAAKNGMRVVLFEADRLGGTCLNRGCIPTKALLHATAAYADALGGEKLGVRAENVTLDHAAMHRYKNGVVDTLRAGIEKLLKADKVTVVNAYARVTAVKDGAITIEAGGETYEAAYLIVAAGSVPSVPPIEGSGLPGVYVSDDILEGEGRHFGSLIIIGGGVIGCECASLYRSAGAEVTVIEALGQLLPTMDREIAQRLTMYFKKRGIAVSTSAKVTRIGGVPGDMTVTYTEKAGAEHEARAEGVLIATGRKANVAGIFAADAPACERGAVAGDEKGRTSLPNVYVIGDAKAGNIQLAHVAQAQGRNAVAAILGKPAPVDMSVVPSCIYTSPEIASVGLSEEAAKAAGLAVRTHKVLTGSNGKCVIVGAEAGYIKTVAREADGVLVGAQLICPRATDLVGELALAIAAGLTADKVAGVIHPHPTFSEMIPEACGR